MSVVSVTLQANLFNYYSLQCTITLSTSQPGYIGDKCENECPSGKFGLNCSQSCDCLNGASCEKATGECICRKGYSGSKCATRHCPDDKFGEKCDKKCQCHGTNSLHCDSWDGTCRCKPGFKGNCYKQCSPPYYGEDCKEICNCSNGICHHITGNHCHLCS